MLPHPLAVRLIEHLRTVPQARVLDFASGSGRNAQALRQAGSSVVTIDDRAAASSRPFAGVAGPFSAVLSTHGLLHGTPGTVAENVSQIARLLAGGGVLYATFGSVRDARFGRGRRVDEFTFAPEEGDERGVAHAYFDRERLTGLLAAHFDVASLEERNVDEIAGTWAHRERPLAGGVHWFAIVTAR